MIFHIVVVYFCHFYCYFCYCYCSYLLLLPFDLVISRNGMTTVFSVLELGVDEYEGYAVDDV